MSAENSSEIFKICARTEWDEASEAGVYNGTLLDQKDGFLHFSTATQVPVTLTKYYKGQDNLVVVAFDPTVFGDDLKWESAREGEVFPHVYRSPLTLDPKLALRVEPAEQGEQKQESNEKVAIGYWAIRGLAQAARFMLEYADLPYENDIYTQGDDLNRREWDVAKAANKWPLLFPNLPYLIHGDVKITQSNAIYRYIAKIGQIGSKSLATQALADCLLEQVMDLRNAYVSRVYRLGDFDEHRSMVETKFLPTFDKALSGNEWLCGDEIVAADFHLYEMLFQHKTQFEGILEPYPALQKFLVRFESVPRIKAYLESDRFGGWPFNNKSAKYGGTRTY